MKPKKITKKRTAPLFKRVNGKRILYATIMELAPIRLIVKYILP